jgi:hypothetical protein
MSWSVRPMPSPPPSKDRHQGDSPRPSTTSPAGATASAFGVTQVPAVGLPKPAQLSPRYNLRRESRWLLGTVITRTRQRPSQAGRGALSAVTRREPASITRRPVGVSRQRTCRPSFRPSSHPAAALRAMAWRAEFSAVPTPSRACSRAEVQTACPDGMTNSPSTVSRSERALPTLTRLRGAEAVAIAGCGASDT